MGRMLRGVVTQFPTIQTFTSQNYGDLCVRTSRNKPVTRTFLDSNFTLKQLDGFKTLHCLKALHA